MSHLFRNIQQTTNYAKFRPTYPAALYQFLVDRLVASSSASSSCSSSSSSSSSRVAVDVGCGTGQATFALAAKKYSFERVLGFDPSETQIHQALLRLEQEQEQGTQSIGRIQFQVKDAVEGLKTLEDSSVACVTVAQAAHWFDLPEFYPQVDRVLSEGGILAMWTYGLVEFQDAFLDKIVNQDLYRDILGPYWDDRRFLVEDRYANLPTISTVLPNAGYVTERLDSAFWIDLECTTAELMGYLRSWSAYPAYCAAHDIAPHDSSRDPVQQLQETLEKKGIQVIHGKWPVTLLWSQKV